MAMGIIVVTDLALGFGVLSRVGGLEHIMES